MRSFHRLFFWRRRHLRYQPSTLSTMALVTCSDMIPFVPCQPLAITLGASLGRINLGIFHLCRGWWVKQTTLAGRIAPLKTGDNAKTSRRCYWHWLPLRDWRPSFPFFSAGNYCILTWRSNTSATRTIYLFLPLYWNVSWVSNFISVSVGMWVAIKSFKQQTVQQQQQLWGVCVAANNGGYGTCCALRRSSTRSCARIFDNHICTTWIVNDCVEWILTWVCRRKPKKIGTKGRADLFPSEPPPFCWRNFVLHVSRCKCYCQ
jgi:hypothetical protein